MTYLLDPDNGLNRPVSLIRACRCNKNFRVWDDKYITCALELTCNGLDGINSDQWPINFSSMEWEFYEDYRTNEAL